LFSPHSIPYENIHYINISDRIIKEAKSLLLHTDWPINEIAYSLGFEYPTYFIDFFKKKPGKLQILSDNNLL
jgi:YesN/AraC family two-component response regulator